VRQIKQATTQLFSAC